MTDDPTVAAILPTRNRADRLKTAVQSVFDQTYDAIKIVIVDGGSTDRTPEVIGELQNEVSTNRLIYIRNEGPRGPSAARNRGVQATDAEYIAFLDDDDAWHPEKTERQLQRMGEVDGRVGAVYSGFTSVTDSGRQIHSRYPTLGGDIYQNLLVEDVIGPPATMIVSREAFNDVNGFDETYSQHEDWDLYLRIAHNYKIVCVSEPLVTRGHHEDERSRDVEAQMASRERLLSQNRNKLEAHGLTAEAWANHHREAGIAYCLDGNTKTGRQEFRRSLQFKTTRYTVALYVAALLGSTGFNTATYLKRNVNQARKWLEHV